MLFPKCRSFRRPVLASSLFTLLLPVHVAWADSSDVERHMRQLLNTGSVDDEISVIQLRSDTYQMTAKTLRLFEAFKLKPDRMVIPAKIDIQLQDRRDGSWRFTAKNQFASSSTRYEGSKRGRSVFNAKQAEMEGIFDPNPEQESHLQLNYLNGFSETEFETAYERADFGAFRYGVYERPGPDGYSDMKVTSGVTDAIYKKMAPDLVAYLSVKSVDILVSGTGLNYKSIKDKLRFGDILAMHASEGEPDYPENSVIGMRGYFASFHAKELESTEGGSGLALDSLDIYATGQTPSEKSQDTIAITAKGMSVKGVSQEEALRAFIPEQLTMSSHVTGFDSRLAHLFINTISRLGTNNKLAYLEYDFVPDKKLSWKDISGRLSNERFAVSVRGEFSYDFKQKPKFDYRLVVQTPDLEKMLAFNRLPARRDKLRGQVQTALYFLKGLGKLQPGGSYEWIVSKGPDDKVYVNGNKFRFPL